MRPQQALALAASVATAAASPLADAPPQGRGFRLGASFPLAKCLDGSAPPKSAALFYRPNASKMNMWFFVRSPDRLHNPPFNAKREGKRVPADPLYYIAPGAEPTKFILFHEGGGVRSDSFDDHFCDFQSKKMAGFAP